MLRTVGVLEEDPEAIVNGYIKQCSIKVTVKDLAMIAGVLANGEFSHRLVKIAGPFCSAASPECDAHLRHV